MVEKTFIITGTVPAGQSANSILPFQITFDPVRGAQDYYQVPTFGALVIKDIFVSATQGVNGVLRLKVNGIVVYETHPINSLLISNPSRPHDPPENEPIGLLGGDKLEVEFINLDPGDSTNPTPITVYMKVDEIIE